MTPKTSNGGIVKILIIAIGILVSALGVTLGWGVTAIQARLKKVDTMTIEVSGIKKDIEYIKENMATSDGQIGTVIEKLNALDKKVDVHLASHKP